MNIDKIILYLIIFLVIITFINTNQIENFFNTDDTPVRTTSIKSPAVKAPAVKPIDVETSTASDVPTSGDLKKTAVADAIKTIPQPSQPPKTDKLLEQITSLIANETQKIVSKLGDMQEAMGGKSSKQDASNLDKLQSMISASMDNMNNSLSNVEITNKTIMNLITDNVSEQRLIGGMNILLGIGILIILLKKNV